MVGCVPNRSVFQEDEGIVFHIVLFATSGTVYRLHIVWELIPRKVISILLEKLRAVGNKGLLDMMMEVIKDRHRSAVI